MTMAPERPTTPATASDRGARPSWDRWARLWEGFSALTLAVPTVVAVAQAPTAGHAAVTVAFAGGLAGWHWLTAVRRPDWGERAPMLLWLAGLLVFTWLLLGRHESYVFLLYGLYPQLFSRLGRWAVPGVVGLTAVVFGATGVLTADSLSSVVFGVGGSVLLALLIGFFVTALVRQTEAREEALAALEATRAELTSTARRAGVLAERERVARDLHDTIAQGFTGIVMQLEAAEHALDRDPEAAAAHLDRARHAARDSLAELRRAVHALRPQELEGANLAEAIERSATRWSQVSGIPASAIADGDPRPLPPDVEVALLRTAQEGLANVAKHACASSASVTVAYAPERVALTVSDDGVGFEPTAAAGTGGAGLTGLAERLDALGGSLRVDSAPGAGTTIVAEVPTP